MAKIALESVSHVIGILRNTSNRQLVDRQMGKGASSGHQLLGVSLVVLWHFDETILGLKSYHMVKEQSNMNHVTKNHVTQIVE